MITFIATAHNESRHDSPFVDSMLNQKSKEWKAIIFHNGPNPKMKEWIESYNNPQLEYYESAHDTGNWGTFNREQAVMHLVDTSYVINTSIQDYYLPCAVGDITEIIKEDVDFLSWPAINHLYRYYPINGELANGHIDWGQFCVKTSIIKSTGIVGKDKFNGDWLTIHAILHSRLLKKVKKLDKIITIHN
jgi:DNA-binding transcriptional ArsR family regulator